MYPIPFENNINAPYWLHVGTREFIDGPGLLTPQVRGVRDKISRTVPPNFRVLFPTAAMTFPSYSALPDKVGRGWPILGMSPMHTRLMFACLSRDERFRHGTLLTCPRGYSQEQR